MSEQPKPLYALCEELRKRHSDYLFRSAHHREGWHQGREEAAKELEAALKAWDAELVRAHGNSVPLEVRNIIEQIRWRLLGFKLEGIGQPREQILGLPKGTGE